MTQNESCDGCSEKSRCREVFRRLGNEQGKSIFPGVFLAFVLPLLIFIAVLAVSLEVLAKFIESVNIRTAASVIAAFTASAAFVFIAKIIMKRTCKK